MTDYQYEAAAFAGTLAAVETALSEGMAARDVLPTIRRRLEAWKRATFYRSLDDEVAALPKLAPNPPRGDEE